MFSVEQLKEKYETSPSTKVITLRECWSVIFDTNGNAPADAHVVACATKELAERTKDLFAAEKDGKRVGIVLDRLLYTDLPAFSLDGYDFDSAYVIKADWQPDDKIIRSLAELIGICDKGFDSDLPDGIVIDFD